jgi:hypothetical protein
MKRFGASVLLSGLAIVALAGCAGGGAVEGGEGRAEPAPLNSMRDDLKTSAGLAARPAEVPKEFCAFLKDEVPELKERGSGLASLARFAADYAGWVSEDANRMMGTASELDAMTSTTCPKIRSQVLGALDRESLADVLGR